MRKHVTNYYVPLRQMLLVASVAAIATMQLPARADDSSPAPAAAVSLPRALIKGDEPGFVALGESDFVNVNCAPETWTWKDGVAHCTGKPTGVIRSVKSYTNFELVCQWRHLRNAGNSGIFVWMTEESWKRLEAARRPGLPKGIEVQVLDTGYTEFYEKHYKKPANWFTCHGDVFPVGVKMTPFPPVAPDKIRSFPTKQLSRPSPEWNHYYVRAINGEVRLWVNGEEVSGGTDIKHRAGHLGLESEGSPVEFRNIRMRELP
jgi:hypothetical protein